MLHITKDTKEIVGIITAMGYTVVRMEEAPELCSFYVMNEFNPADDDAFKHHFLIGKDITTWISTRAGHQSIAENEKTSFAQQLEAQRPQTMEFHKDIRWKKYLTY